jgi:hypothetical protein
LKKIRNIEFVEIHGAFEIIAKIENLKREKARETITQNIRKINHAFSLLH